MEAMRVEDIMTRQVTTVKRDAKLTSAYEMMGHEHIRHLLVVEGEEQRLVGLVTQRDLFRGSVTGTLAYVQKSPPEMPDFLVVGHAMTSNPITTTPQTLLRDAARVMQARKIGCLPVVKDGRLAGILTEGDFVALIAERG